MGRRFLAGLTGLTTAALPAAAMAITLSDNGAIATGTAPAAGLHTIPPVGARGGTALVGQFAARRRQQSAPPPNA